MTDVLDGYRYKTTLDGDNWYITVNRDETGPKEVWITVPDENKRSSQRPRSNSQTVAALVSELLQNGTEPSRVIEIMSCSVTIPQCESAMIADALCQYMEGE